MIMKWLAVIAAGMTSAAAFGVEPKVYQIPYRLTDTKHVLVRVKMNGHGPYNFILDTGAPAMFITTKAAKEVGLTSKPGWGNFESLVIEGGLKVEKARARAEDLFQLEGMNSLGLAGFELHGVIGYEILARYRITYDFTKDKIAWEPLDFKPAPLQGVGGGGQGSLEMLGPILKVFGGMMGIKPNFNAVGRGYTGVTLRDDRDSVVIDSVWPGSPAEKAGLKPGDRIAKGQSKTIAKSSDLHKVTEKLKPGDRVTLDITRDGQTQSFTIELGKGL